ncbi:MAG: OmpA family protein [Methylobacter sp.]|uniref:OmpA family protein n=1 Tax=Methylobacter sp. TaxID=2051955 RepID=UPI0025846679|nr:OmpA family protein [Methylobacter sp.]MCL7421172.1 OmpA family protein [Methylobacter sp.]
MGIFKKTNSITLAIVCCLTSVNVLWAEDLNVGARAPTKEEIIQAFKPHSERGDKVLTRGIRIRPTGQAGLSSSLASTPQAISLEVRFAFNSAQLTEEAIRQLTPVAEALVSGELGQLNFHVEGYTDAKGSDEYNKDLSLKRAFTVRNFFVKRHGLNASRIKFSGLGKSNLLDPDNPYSEVNRRVRVVAIP